MSSISVIVYRFSKPVVVALVALSLCGLAACNQGPTKSDGAAAVNAKSEPADSGEKLNPGKEFLPFALEAPDSKKIQLKDFRGKLVLVNFWATWCAPCVAEMPALERLYQTYKDKGLAVIAITVDSKDSWPDVVAFAKRTGLSFPIAYDPDMELPPQLGITGFPESFFVGPDGKLVAFLDPDTKKSSVRIISDRPWDAPIFLKAVGDLLEKHLG